MVKAFLILLFSLTFYFPKNIQDISAHSQTQIVEITKEGFTPQEASVDTGSTIIFINKDSFSHWPASNVHPTHDLYPEFDPKSPVKPAQSWAFKPKKAGEWKYHDHLSPHLRGIVIVTKEEGEVEENIEAETKVNLFDNVKKLIDKVFLGLKNVFKTGDSDKEKKQTFNFGGFKTANYQKQEEMVQKVAEEQGGQAAWQNIKKAFSGQSGSSGNIHDIAHLVGGLIFNEKGITGLKLCSSEFAFGCYHGFLDKAFAKSLDNLAEAQDACLGLGRDGSGPAASCIHGIGHGIASNFLTTDLKKSLSTCRKLTSGQEYCFDGVFMEFVRSAPGSFYKVDDPLYPCTELENDFGYIYSFSCGRNQPPLLMGRFRLPFEEVSSICLASTSKPLKEGCVEALGFSLAATVDVEKIIEGCNILGIEFSKICIQKAAGELVFQDSPSWWEKSQTLCASIPDGETECLGYVNNLASEYGRKRKINFAPLKKEEEPNDFVRSVLSTCFELGGSDDCYKEAAGVLYKNLGLSKTLGLLSDNESYKEVYARCHEVTHYLSRFEYEKQKNIAKVYSQCDSTCHGGCYHGTLEAYLKEQESKKEYNLNSEFSKICGDKKTYQKPLEFNECLHGLGHAAMFVTDIDLPVSLKLCDSLPTQDYKERCYTGVFMENSSSSTSFDHKSNYVKADDPFYPCNVLDEKYQPLCWQYQSSYFSTINNQDFVKVADMCLQIPKKYQERCFRTIGTNQVGFTSSLDVMSTNCGLMPTPNFADVCVGGVISSLSYRFVGDSGRMFSFCSLVGPSHKETCFRQIGTSVLEWDKNPVFAQKICENSPDPAGKDWCMEGLGQL